MPRLMAEVLEVTQQEAPNGAQPGVVRARLRVTGAAPKGLALPEGVIGREGEITRRVLFTWELEAGMALLLGVEESRAFLAPDDLPPPPPPPAAARMRLADEDRDGFSEWVLENRYVVAKASPDRGGRLAGLAVREGSIEWLAPSLELASEWLDLGGCEDRLGSGTGELWKARWEASEAEAGEGEAVRLCLRHSPESPKGLSLSKRLSLEAEVPAVRLETSIHYAGEAERKPEPDSEPDRYDLSYALRLAARPTVGGTAKVDSDLRLSLPLDSRVERLRHHAGQWCYPVSGLALGAIALEDDRAGCALLVLTSPEALGNIAPDFLPNLLELRVAMRFERLQPKRQRTHGFLLAAGSSLAASERAVALAAVGSGPSGKRTVAVVARGREAAAGTLVAEGREAPLTYRHDLEVGGYLVGSLATDSDTVEVLLGEERLSLSLPNRNAP